MNRRKKIKDNKIGKQWTLKNLKTDRQKLGIKLTERLCAYVIRVEEAEEEGKNIKKRKKIIQSKRNEEKQKNK